MPRLSGAIERSFGLYFSSRHARQGQHHLDCSLVSLSGIAQALTNLCWPRFSGRFQMHMLLIYLAIIITTRHYKVTFALCVQLCLSISKIFVFF